MLFGVMWSKRVQQSVDLEKLAFKPSDLEHRGHWKWRLLPSERLTQQNQVETPGADQTFCLDWLGWREGGSNAGATVWSWSVCISAKFLHTSTVDLSLPPLCGSVFRSKHRKPFESEDWIWEETRTNPNRNELRLNQKVFYEGHFLVLQHGSTSVDLEDHWASQYPQQSSVAQQLEGKPAHIHTKKQQLEVCRCDPSPAVNHLPTKKHPEDLKPEKMFGAELKVTDFNWRQQEVVRTRSGPSASLQTQWPNVSKAEQNEQITEDSWVY